MSDFEVECLSHDEAQRLAGRQHRRDERHIRQQRPKGKKSSTSVHSNNCTGKGEVCKRLTIWRQHFEPHNVIYIQQCYTCNNNNK